jgi:hypothetical protein
LGRHLQEVRMPGEFGPTRGSALRAPALGVMALVRV